MIVPVLYAGAVLLAAAALFRMGFLLTRRVPVRADVCGSDLTEMQRRHDAFMAGMARRDEAVTPDDIPFRSTRLRVAYLVDGTEYRADVRVLRDKGERPDASLIVWYDPRQPDRATAFGIGASVAAWLAAGGMAITAHFWPV